MGSRKKGLALIISKEFTLLTNHKTYCIGVADSRVPKNMKYNDSKRTRRLPTLKYRRN